MAFNAALAGGHDEQPWLWKCSTNLSGAAAAGTANRRMANESRRKRMNSPDGHQTFRFVQLARIVTPTLRKNCINAL